MARLRIRTDFRLSGFTLVELIVVIAILAVLATVGFLALSGYSDQAKESRSKTNVRSVYSAIVSESASSGKSPRYYVVHDSDWALSGASVSLPGGSTVLVGGNWDQPGTNYSVGNPDFSRLRLDPAKFRISAPGGTFGLFSLAYAAGTDTSRPVVGAADVLETAGSRTRTRTFVQVASARPSETAFVEGNYPAGLSGSVAGLIKNEALGSLTGALVNGVKIGEAVEEVGFVFNKTISSNVQNYNLKTDAIAAGWNQAEPLLANVTINAGVVVGSANTSSYAFVTGT